MSKANDEHATGGSAELADNDYVFEAAASFAQQRLWFLDQLEPGLPVYNINFAIELNGALNESALQAALDFLVARHESLRTTFDRPEQDPVQVIARPGSSDLKSSMRQPWIATV